MKNSRRMFLSAGISSVMLVFILLLMITFAVLSLSSSHADLQFARKLADRTSDYYEAETKANARLAEIDEVLIKQYQASSGPEEFYKKAGEALKELEGIEIKRTEEGEAKELKAAFYVAIQEKEQLSVVIAAAWPEQESDSFYRIIQWKTEQTGEWEADQKLPVLQREQREE